MRLFIMLLLGVTAMTTSASGAGTPAELYISDQPDLIVFRQQGWGQLGLGTMAFNPGDKTLPIQIGETVYAKGLGTHADSEIILDLRGRYLEFQAEVGVQKYDPPMGSVVFQVFVDEKKVFDSGLMRVSTPARRVNIPLAGADELKLVVTNGGDGITCDMANWADARLTPDPEAKTRALAQAVDMGRFAQVLSWDPDRKDGTHAGRTQEFPAEDLFRETELFPDSSGAYCVPVRPDGAGCIGLQWLEPRHVEALELEFVDPGTASADGVTAEYWGPTMERGASSGSRWQGQWKPLKGEIKRDGAKLVLDVDWTGNSDKSYGVTKVRWIVPASMGQAKVNRPVGYTDSPWATTDVILQIEKPQPGARAQVAIYNGDIVDGGRQSETIDWDLSKPLELTVRYGVPKRWMYDRTSLRIKLPDAGFGVAIDDLLKHRSVYVRDFGFYATLATGGESLESYKKRTAPLRTVLERVREMPDQTLSQAIEKMHRPDADLGPTMISLACDNHKFLLARDGGVSFDPNHGSTGSNGTRWDARLVRSFGEGKDQSIRRSLMKGWMPIVAFSVKENDAEYTQVTYVAPFGSQPAGSMPGSNDKSLCVSQLSAANPTAKPKQFSISLSVEWATDKKQPAQIQQTPQGTAISCGGRLLAYVDTRDAGPLKVAATGDSWALSGALQPGGTAGCSLLIPAWDATVDDLREANVGELLSATQRYWLAVTAGAMQVELPDEYMENIIRANQVHCMLAARNEEDIRVSPWIASAAYGPLESEAHSVIRGMMYTGNLDWARRALEFFIERYNEQGFLTTGYTFLGTGWHLWALGEYYSLTQDREWMKSVAPEVARVCKWAMAQREKTKRLDAHGNKVPEWGLMPPGVLADWSVYAYYYYLNGNFSAGLESAGAALAAVGYPGADEIVRSGRELAEETLRSYRRVQGLAPVVPLKDGTWVQANPTQAYSIWPTAQMYPGSDSGRSWCYDVELGAGHLVPLGVMPPLSREAREMMDYMEDVQFLADGWFYYPADLSEKDWFNRGGFAKVQPYYARTGEIYALQDEVKPFVRTYVNSVVSLLNREDLSLWEHFVNGAFNKTHETGYFLYQSRAMMLDERGGELWIAPFANSHWMKNGLSVGVRNAPSTFGPVTYRMTSHVNDGYIEATIAEPSRTAPDAIVVRFRHPEGKRIRSATVNGRPCTDIDPVKETVRFAPTGGRDIVRVRY